MSNFDLSQFYTRRNSNYKVSPELANRKPMSVVDKYKGDETCVCAESSTAMLSVNPKETESSICGFLFSVSRSQTGEYWPIKIGVNTIGCSEVCDIRLEHASVKETHAILTATYENGELMFRIEGESCIQINGSDISGQVVCCDRDILTIGDVYQLLILYADPLKYGLEPAKDFCNPIHIDEDSPTTTDATIVQSVASEGTVFI